MHSIAKNRSVYNVGINDANYSIQPKVDGKQICCHFYHRWQSMLQRCYSKEYHSRKPTYVSCKVCDEWHSFMAFRSWMELQDWKGKQLDKDLIGDGKLYSPENCVFISSELNKLFNSNESIQGKYPLGVNFQNGKYRATIKENGKKKSLGYFTSTNEAHEAWLKAKLEIASDFLAKESNPRVRYAIECGIAKLK